MNILIHIRNLWIIVFCVFLVSACGDDAGNGNVSPYDSGSYETGGIDFNIRINARFANQSNDREISAGLSDCERVGISSIMIRVYDAFNFLIAVGGPWACTADSGIVEGVPAGKNYKVVVLCMDSLNQITYKGFRENVEVLPGRMSRLGVIDAYFYIPILVSVPDGAVVYGESLVFTWTAVNGAVGYHIVVFESTDLIEPVVDDVTQATSYTFTGFSDNTVYYWQVFAIDPTGNEATGSEIWSVNVAPSGEPPDICVNGESREITCGVGACMSSVVQTCIDVTWIGEACVPGVPSDEVCDDGVDQDCNGSDLSCDDVDDDGDQFTENQGDCNDDDPDINPDAAEIPDNGIDEDCTGADALTWYPDSDVDTYGAYDNPVVSESQPDGYVYNNDDCDDSDAAVHPGADEIPDNGTDENCDGYDARIWYLDSDGDGYGDPDYPLSSDTQPDGYVSDNTDCNDTNSAIHPGAEEMADNGIDEDCTGLDAVTWYEDVDSDGYGNMESVVIAEAQPDGYVSDNTDCNDDDPDINPGAAEMADNGIDEDCTGADALTWYPDSDVDTYGAYDNPVVSESQPDGYVYNNDDCDDSDAAVHPGADEIPDNGIDENCDGYDDQIWYVDSDGDLYGDPSYPIVSDTQPDGYVSDNTDCDDTNSAIHPGAAEVPDNEIDEDCTGLDAMTWYEDADSDGYGNMESMIIAEAQPAGYVSDNTDCNDDDSDINPGAAEIADNGIDEDCTGADALTWYPDSDVDTYGAYDNPVVSESQPDGYVYNNDDCDDSDAAVHPGADEIPDNGIDENCDGYDDQTWYVDSDGDLYGDPSYPIVSDTQPDGYVSDNTDCDDTNSAIHPGAAEVPDNEIDEDCTGLDAMTWYEDVDSDGYGNSGSSYISEFQPDGYVLNDTDCNDDDSGINPGATEIPDNDIDEDCTGLDALIWYQDFDTDTYGNPDLSVVSEIKPADYVTDNSDCDDTNSGIHPEAEEICDNLDNDCDNDIDEGVQITYYQDYDEDGYGNPEVSVLECTLPEGFAENNADCDDTNSGIHPEAEEICDNLDNDCDNDIDEGVQITYYQDYDGDGYGNPEVSVLECTMPEGFAENNADCDDTNSSIHPEAEEICDNLDNDCDNDIDEDVLTILYVDSENTASGDGTSWAQAFGTISEAVETAFGGCTEIWVKQGNYYGEFEINQEITMYGGFPNTIDNPDLSDRDWVSNETKIIGRSGSPSVLILTADAVIDGFSITDGMLYGGIYIIDASPTINNCIISDNMNEYLNNGGGGICIIGDASPFITNSVISDNECLGNGGGIYIDSTSSTPTVIKNCTISDNALPRSGYGGGIYGGPISVVNCIIANNDTYSGRGDGIYSNSRAVITNCTLFDNVEAITNIEGATMAVTNSIVWNSDENLIYPLISNSGTLSITYSDIMAEMKYIENTDTGTFEYDLTSNISLDPLFVDVSSGDFHILQNSPCLDAGDNNASEIPELDYEGDFRIIDGDYDNEAVVDMGADERSNIMGTPMLVTPRSGEVLDNGCRDASDVIEWDFDWSDVSEATQYQLYVIGPEASIPAVDITVTSSDYYHVSEGAYIADSLRFNWTWRVRAGNNNDQWGEWSEIRYFDVEELDSDCLTDVIIAADGQGVLQ